MSKVILVSSREPFVLHHSATGVSATRVRSGLLSALEPLASVTSGHWVSWSGLEREGKAAERLPDELEVTEPSGDSGHRWTLRRVPISEREASLFYYGFASRTLWPLMHLHVGRVSFDAEAWRAFRRVNQRFTEAVLAAWEPGDRVWVIDHALCLVPAMLREARPDAAIAISWTLPVAPLEVFRVLPWAADVLQGVLGADFVGVSLPRDADHLRVVASLAGAEEVGDGRLSLSGRTVAVGAIPTGCDAAAWNDRGLAARGGRAVRLKRGLVAERLALAVDRVDRLRGIETRLRAVERFFDRYPSWRGRLVLCQIAVPSRTRAEDYRELKREIDTAVKRVNQRFGDGHWMPVRYLYRSLEPDDLAVYYAAADVAMCTPLADGVSHVPLEYVAARTRGDGSLLLSSLSGSAQVLPEASAVNPYDEEAMAGELHAALQAPAEQVTARMRALRERVRRQDARAFLTRFMSAAFDQELPLGGPAQREWGGDGADRARVSDANPPM